MIVQQDDHIWLVFMGQSWAIQFIEYPLIYLWRGYEPNLEFSCIDVSVVDWDMYCDRAVEMLEKQ